MSSEQLHILLLSAALVGILKKKTKRAFTYSEEHNYPPSANPDHLAYQKESRQVERARKRAQLKKQRRKK